MLAIITEKKCTTCKEIKAVELFPKSKCMKDGLQSNCKKCLRVYYQVNKEKIAKYGKAHYLENKEKIAEYGKTYRKENKEKIIERNKTYRQENKEKKAEYLKSYNKKNKEKKAEYDKAYKKENKEKIADRNKAYFKTPAGKASSKNAIHKRRAFMRQGDVITNQLLELQQTAKQCYWCGTSLKNKVVHIDHYVPLSKGGLHTISNLVVSCAECNRVKGNKPPEEFANSVGKLL